jgi:hypothetical protein
MVRFGSRARRCRQRRRAREPSKSEQQAIDGTGLFAPGVLINNGIIAADGGSKSDLKLLSTVTNNETNGALRINGLANLANSTLTGGTYIA